MHTYMYTHAHTCTHMHTHVHTCTHMHTRMYTHAHPCTHMHTHAHTCTHMHTHLSAREGDSLLSRSTIHELDMPKALEPAQIRNKLGTH